MNKGRVEFLANKNAIEDLLQKGHSLKSTHHILTEKGLISIPYRTFCAYVTYGITPRSITQPTPKSTTSALKQFTPKKKSGPVDIQKLKIADADKNSVGAVPHDKKSYSG